MAAHRSSPLTLFVFLVPSLVFFSLSLPVIQIMDFPKGFSCGCFGEKENSGDYILKSPPDPNCILALEIHASSEPFGPTWLQVQSFSAY